MKQHNFRLDTELVRQARERAVLTGTDLSTVIRGLLTEYVEGRLRGQEPLPAVPAGRAVFPDPLPPPAPTVPTGPWLPVASANPEPPPEDWFQAEEPAEHDHSQANWNPVAGEFNGCGCAEVDS